MTYLSAAYANEAQTAVIATTVELGEVLIVQEHPDAWAALLVSGIEITAYQPPPEPPAE